MTEATAKQDAAEILRSADGATALLDMLTDAEQGWEDLLSEAFSSCRTHAETSAAAKRCATAALAHDDATAELMLRDVAKRSGLNAKQLRKLAKAKAEEDRKQPFARSGNSDDWLCLEVAETFCAEMAESVHGSPPAPPSGSLRAAGAFTGERRVIAHYQDAYWLWNGKAYRRIADGEMASRVTAWIQERQAGKPTTSFVNNVLGNLRGIGGISYDHRPPCWINAEMTSASRILCLENGLLDIDEMVSGTGTLQSHTSRLFSTVSLPYAYDPNALCPRWMAFLEEVIPDEHDRQTIMEWFGYCLIPSQAMQRMLILIGEGANGKSVVCEMLQRLIGHENCSSQPLENIHEGFNLAPMVGKLVNFSTELSHLSSGAEGVVKAITGGDTLTINPKNKGQYEAQINARLTVTTNQMPHVSDRSSGMWRRMIFLRFPVQIAEEKQRPLADLVGELSQEMSGILNWALCGLRELLARGRFLETEESKAVKSEQKLRSNSALAFLEECIKVDERSLNRITKRDLYKAYRSWCDAEGLKGIYAQREFGRQVFQNIKATLPHIDGIESNERTDDGRAKAYRFIELLEDVSPASKAPEKPISEDNFDVI